MNCMLINFIIIQSVYTFFKHPVCVLAYAFEKKIGSEYGGDSVRKCIL